MIVDSGSSSGVTLIISRHQKFGKILSVVCTMTITKITQAVFDKFQKSGRESSLKDFYSGLFNTDSKMKKFADLSTDEKETVEAIAKAVKEEMDKPGNPAHKLLSVVGLFPDHGMDPDLIKYTLLTPALRARKMVEEEIAKKEREDEKRDTLN